MHPTSSFLTSKNYEQVGKDQHGNDLFVKQIEGITLLCIKQGERYIVMVANNHLLGLLDFLFKLHFTFCSDKTEGFDLAEAKLIQVAKVFFESKNDFLLTS